jgi:2-keto-4-pentenoate hydratase/2-oxohepta-3-ene-1,7-dioic acid hydratase in catechol pathway
MGPHDLITRLIEGFPQHRGKLTSALASRQGIPLAKVRLRAPTPKPGKIVCMAVNYMEDGTRKEKPPINAFLKSPRAVVGDGDTVVLTKDKPSVVEHEAELGLVIGKRASHVEAKDWRQYIFGYLNFVDVSSRGLGAPPMDSFFPTKSQHTSAPLGPFLVTADEIADPQNLPVKLWVNGKLRQDYNTNDMAHQLPRVIEWVSSVTVLEPGDVIATGTNHWGLGPMQDKDIVEMEIQGLGRLHLTVRDDLHREWRPETHRERDTREAAEKAAAEKKA